MKRRTPASVAFLLAILLMACKKDSSPTAQGELSITDWIPLKPAFGEELVINGTGFDPVAANNQVIFEGSVEAGILEASPTRLKVIVPELYLTPGYYSTIKIIRGADEVVSDYIYFSRPVTIINVEGFFTGYGLL